MSRIGKGRLTGNEQPIFQEDLKMKQISSFELAWREVHIVSHSKRRPRGTPAGYFW
jgi:hypothetical protein